MVKNFLSRESTYSSLLTNVNDSETRMEKLKNDNVELSERLHELKVNAAGAEEDGDKAGERFQDEELVEMRKHIANQKKDMDVLQDRYRRVNIVND